MFPSSKMIRNLLLTAGLLSLRWVTVCGAVALDLECGTSFKYCPEQRVSMTCAANVTVLRWTIQDDNAKRTHRLFFTITDHVGDGPKYAGPFSARLIGNKSKLLESSLSFTYKEDLNDTTVTCERVDVPALDSCSVFSHDLPEAVEEVTSHVNGCDTILSWTRPVVHPAAGYANITNFTVMLMPEILPMERVQDTQISLTLKLDSTSYNASIQACNCAGCGAEYTEEIFQSNYTSSKNEIINDLTIHSELSHKLHKSENETFTIDLTWEKLQCAFMYLVSITSDTDNKFQVPITTENNSLNISSFKKGNTYKFCVAGVNGNFEGRCLIPLTIDLEVPETVQGLNISKLEANSSHVALSLQWMEPSMSLRPPIIYYIVSHLDQENRADSTNTSLIFNRTILNAKNISSIQIHVNAVNIVGRSNISTREFLIPNSSMSRTASSITAVVTSVVAIVIACVFL